MTQKIKTMNLFNFFLPRSLVRPEVKKCEFGRGVFATRNYRKGELIVRDPVVVLAKQEDISKTILNFYGFAWPTMNPSTHTAFALGIGSLFNHSYGANVTYEQEPDIDTISFSALKDIKRGEQMLINYGYDAGFKWEIYKATLAKHIYEVYENSEQKQKEL